MAKFLVVFAVAFLAPAVIAQDATLPERTYQAKLAKAESDYALAVKKAREELKTELQKLKVDATKAGDLDKAISIRNKIEAIDPVEQIKPMQEAKAVVGRYRFQYSNGHSREYVFTKDGNLVFVKGDENATDTELPGHRAKVYWIKTSDNTVGLIDWGAVGQFERVTFSKDGTILSKHWIAQGLTNAEGQMAK